MPAVIKNVDVPNSIEESSGNFSKLRSLLTQQNRQQQQEKENDQLLLLPFDEGSNEKAIQTETGSLNKTGLYKFFYLLTFCTRLLCF